MHASLHIAVDRQRSKTIVTLTGIINEEFSGDAIGPLRGTVVMDLGGVDAINSLGIRKWVGFINALSGRSVVYERCSRAFAHQLLIVPSLKGHAEVHSMMVDYYCDECESTAARLVTSAMQAVGKIEPVICEECQGEMEPDLAPAKVLTLPG